MADDLDVPLPSWIAAELHKMPADELAFVIIKVPDFDAGLDHSAMLRQLSEQVREANANACVLVLPSDWSFRTMPAVLAREFMTNMASFVSDKDFAEIGLARIEPEDVNRG